jgi:hypothetical protein
VRPIATAALLRNVDDTFLDALADHLAGVRLMHAKGEPDAFHAAPGLQALLPVEHAAVRELEQGDHGVLGFQRRRQEGAAPLFVERGPV